jgi:hypothetical protein
MERHIVSVVLVVCAFAARAAFAQTVVMSGLDNPRGIALGPDGGIYVAEAGRGGTGMEIIGGEGQPVQYGATGAVSRYLNGTQERVITGLPSLASQAAPAAGARAGGLQDIVFDGTGQMFGLIGLGGDPAKRDLLGADGTHFAHLVRLPIGGAPQNVADIGAHEAAANPDGLLPDTNPYGFVRTATGFAVADAGGNALLGVTPAGAVSTIAVLPNRPNPLPFGPPTYQAVPTSVTVGPDGAYYVGQLTGFPFPVGASTILRVDPTTGAQTVAFDGLTNVIDLAFGPDGDLYVLQISTNGLAASQGPGPGRLLRIDRDTGTRTTLLEDPLFFPGGFVIAPGGEIYVSNLGTSAGTGQVLMIVPEPYPGFALMGGIVVLSLRRRGR